MPTLSVDEIMADTLDAFKTSFPMINAISTDFSSKTAKKDDTITAHVSTLPAVQSYNASTGYKANAAEASSLITDVPVVLDQLKHVPVKIDYLDAISSKKDLYQEAIRNQAYVLGKSVMDALLAKVVDANFSNTEVVTIANTDKTTLDSARKNLNTQDAQQSGRFGIVNSDFFAELEDDQKIASGDYHGQRVGNKALGHLTNVSGFENVWEYPDLPDNSENLTSFFGDRRALVCASRLPSDAERVASQAGVPQIASFSTITDPDSGLSLMGIGWQEQGTFDTYLTIALLYGTAAGSQGGADGALLDNAGYRVTSA